jgi:hypothetical protein
MLSLSWAMPLYGMKQMLNLGMPRDMSRPFGEATDGFMAVTGAMREHLGPTMKSLFDAGDQIQRGLMDAAFSLGFGTFDPNAWSRMGASMRRSAPGMQQGWGGGGQQQSGAAGCGCESGQQRSGDASQRAADWGNRAADATARATDLGMRSMEQGARAMTDAAYATAAALGYQPSGSGRSGSGSGHSNRSR